MTSISAHALPGEASDRSLLQSVHRGDERAFEELFLRHYGWLHGVVLRVTGDPEEAEEIVQDTFLRLYQQPIAPDDTLNLRGWLYRVASNAAFNAVRARTRRVGWLRRLARRVDTRVDADDPYTLVAARDDAERVRRCLAEMPERQRNVLLLRAAGHSYVEIAATLSVKPGSIGTLLARAERAFRQRYEREYGARGMDGGRT